jgi:dynein heavy chain
MLASMKDVIVKAVHAYASTPRAEWVLEWPGQVILCGDSIFWNMDVAEAITVGTLPVSNEHMRICSKLTLKCLYFPIPQNYLILSNQQIEEVVGLVRGKLDQGARMTLGALIVIAVHGMSRSSDFSTAHVSIYCPVILISLEYSTAKS